MMGEAGKVRLGFVPLHREPFDEEWARKLRSRTINVLSSLEEITLVYPDEKLTKNGLVRNDEDASKTIGLFKSRGIHGLILGTMTFGDEVAGSSIAQALCVPTLVFGTKEPPISSEGFRSSDSFCGTLSLTSGLYRRKIPFDFAGIVFPEENHFLEKVRVFARACSSVRAFLGAKVGVFGPRPERFETCTYNEVAMINKFGQRAVPYDLTGVILGLSKIPEDNQEVTRVMEQIKSYAEVTGIPVENLLKMAKLEVLLKNMAEKDGLSALGFRCWTEIQDLYGISVCHVLGRLTEQGLVSACESDVYGALTMLMQYWATLGKSAPHFVDWTIRHPEKEDLVLMWHCGNAPPSLACAGCKLAVRYHSILYRAVGEDRSQGTGEFRLKPGAVTINRLVEYDGEFKMLIVGGEIVEEGPYTRGSYSWVRIKNLDEVYRMLVNEGFIHHASMVHGDISREIESACRFLGIKVVKP
ncbi:MAG: L-fucose/L-arabinose isomerase family protein [Thermoproteota archaeon]